MRNEKRTRHKTLRNASGAPRQRTFQPPPPTKSKYLHQFLQSNEYIEELAFHHFRDFANDDQKLDELGPLPPPPFEIPTPPCHSSISWNYDPQSRVYVVDFSSVDCIPNEQKLFLGLVMERDDITVICEGLHDWSFDVQQFLHEFGCSFGDRSYEKFRQFMPRYDDSGVLEYEEQDGYTTLNVKHEYLNYLARYVYGGSDFHSCEFDLQQTKSSAVVAEETLDSAVDDAGITDNQEPCIYMTDVEMATRFPSFDRLYKKKFKMEEILPGGNWCLMSHVRDGCRWRRLKYIYASNQSCFSNAAPRTIATVYGTEFVYLSR